MLPSKDFIMDLARLTVAAAWADGELANDEIDALRELLWGLEHVSAEDWTILEMYMAHPVGKEEADALLARVIEGITDNQHKALVLETMTALFEADGVVTPEEREFLAAVEGAVAGVNPGVFSLFAKAMRSAVGQRRMRSREDGLREKHVEDFVQNPIYYRFQRRQEADGLTVDLPDAELRRLCLAAGVMARVAHADGELSAEEQEEIATVIAEGWNVPPELAAVLAELTCEKSSRELDFSRIAYNYFTCTTHDERRALLALLFRVANCCGGTSHDEIEEIRQIASVLKLAHQDFIEAKLTIPRDDRGGL